MAARAVRLLAAMPAVRNETEFTLGADWRRKGELPRPGALVGGLHYAIHPNRYTVWVNNVWE
jgi:hypothetical protein